MRGLIFAALPLCFIESLCWVGIIRRPILFPAYIQAMQAAGSGGLDFVFLGSSRVAAAIETATFERVVHGEAGLEVRAANLGRGYSTLAEDYFAIRRLYESGGQRTDGLTVFVEAPEGLPSYARFDDSWVDSSEPALIIPLLAPKDLWRFWIESGTPLRDRAEVLVRYSIGSLEAVAVARRSVQAVGQAVLGRIVKRLRPSLHPPAEDGDLRTAGGIRADQRTMALARRKAEELAQTTADLRTTIDWPETILMELNRLVRSHGGRLVVFRMPLSTVQQLKPGQRAAAARFATTTRSAGIIYLDVPFRTSDDDFPDAWHFRKSRSDEFTEALAMNYLEQLGAEQAARKAIE